MLFNDLKKQYRLMELEIKQNIEKVLNHGQYIMGPEVYEVERKLADYTGMKHVISCDNGTNAIAMALKAYKIGVGDCVFVPTLTFFASAEAVSTVGAIPVFCDVNDRTFNLCPDCLESAIKKTIKEGKYHPKAIIVVDLYGLPADYARIRPIAEKYNLIIIEDGAQSFGAAMNGKKACSLGDIASTSFFPSKPLGCYGDGGAIFTNDDAIAEFLISIRHHGMGSHKYNNIRIGGNARLDTIQAAVLLAKLRHFEKELLNRQAIAKKYKEGINAEEILTPYIPREFISAWAQYTVILPVYVSRDYLMNQLKENDIPTMIYYPIPLHLQEAYAFLCYKKGDFPVAERLCRSIVSLPMSGYLEEEEIRKICININNLKFH